MILVISKATTTDVALFNQEGIRSINIIGGK